MNWADFLLGFYFGAWAYGFWGLFLQTPEFAANTGRSYPMQILFAFTLAGCWPIAVLSESMGMAKYGWGGDMGPPEEEDQEDSS